MLLHNFLNDPEVWYLPFRDSIDCHRSVIAEEFLCELGSRWRVLPETGHDDVNRAPSRCERVKQPDRVESLHYVLQEPEEGVQV